MAVSALLISIGSILLLFISILVFIARCYKKVKPGQAIIRTGMGATRVDFSGIFVIPVLHQYEILDITLKIIKIDCTREKALISKDGRKMNIESSFYIRVNPDINDVIKVSQTIGVSKAENQKHLESLFQSFFTRALKVAVKGSNFQEIKELDDEFLMKVFRNVGVDLNGFILDNISIDSVEEIPLKKMEQ